MSDLSNKAEPWPVAVERPVARTLERPSSGKAVLFVSFAQEQADGKRRIAQAARGGAKIVVYKSKIDKNRMAVRLRVGAYVRLLLFLVLSRTEQIWWLWGADACFIGSIAGLFRPTKIVIWDINDIQPRFLAKSAFSRLLRAVEGALIKRCQRLILSSSAFWDHYYSRRVPSERISIIENLLEGTPSPVDRMPPKGPVNVIYSGIIRGETLMRLILDCAKECRGTATFHLWGFFHPEIRKATLEEFKRTPNIIYHGEYNQQSLAALYRDMHVTFGMLDIDANNNEKWLLSNRLYQAGAFRCPIVATRGSMVGEVAVERKLGWALDNDCRQLSALLMSLQSDPEAYSEMVRSMPDQRQFYFGDEYSSVLANL